MKKISRILSMVIVVGLIAAIPASTQILSGSSGESSDGINLPMIILVNRLELSEEQMEALHDILIDLLQEKETVDVLRAEFEEVMIEFNGTGEELDELLAAFREGQRALAEAMRESIEASLDEVRDLLSINQGIVLREALPELLDGGTLLGPDRSVGRLQNTPEMMGNRVPSLPMGRSGMMGQMQQAARGGQRQSPMQGSMSIDRRSGSGDRDSMSRMMQERVGDDTMLEMFGQRFGQGNDDVDTDTMMEQMRDRFEQFGDQVPAELREQLEDRLGGAIENLRQRLGRNFGGNLGQMGGRAGNVMPGQGDMGQLGGNSFPTQRLQSIHGEQFGEHGNLAELLEQLSEVLELKLEAIM